MLAGSRLIKLSHCKYVLSFIKREEWGDPWVAKWFSTCVQPRAWSWSPGIESHIRFPAWSLLHCLCLCLCLSASLSLSLMNKWIKSLKKREELLKWWNQEPWRWWNQASSRWIKFHRVQLRAIEDYSSSWKRIEKIREM